MNRPRLSKRLILVPVFLTIYFSMTGTRFHTNAQEQQPEAQTAQKIYDASIKRLYKRDYSKALAGAEAALNIDASFAPALYEQLETLRAYAQLSDRADASRTVFGPKEVTTKARVLNSPTTSPPGGQRTVTVMVVLATDGKVKHIMLLDPIDESKEMKEYLKSVGAMKFRPAIKDGREVSQVLLIVSHFGTM